MDTYRIKSSLTVVTQVETGGIKSNTCNPSRKVETQNRTLVTRVNMQGIKWNAYSPSELQGMKSMLWNSGIIFFLPHCVMYEYTIKCTDADKDKWVCF